MVSFGCRVLNPILGRHGARTWIQSPVPAWVTLLRSTVTSTTNYPPRRPQSATASPILDDNPIEVDPNLPGPGQPAPVHTILDDIAYAVRDYPKNYVDLEFADIDPEVGNLNQHPTRRRTSESAWSTAAR